MTELEALAHWLPIHGLALAAGARLERLGGGIANRNEGVMLASGPTTFRAVLRRPPPGPLAAGASDMAREARVLAALAPHFPLAPRLIAFCADEAVLGTQFQLIERRDGAAIAGTLPPASGDGLALVETTLQAMAALHALDPATLGLAICVRKPFMKGLPVVLPSPSSFSGTAAWLKIWYAIQIRNSAPKIFIAMNRTGTA